MSWLRMDKLGVIVEIHAQPQARKNEVVGLHNDRLKVKIKSPPVDGKANECLIDYLADLLGTSRSKIRILKGETSRQKQVLLVGLTLEEVESQLLKRTTA